MGATDYLEQYFAINIVFEPLVGELFRSGFLMQVAAANNDFITPPVISAAEADYERNLANTIDLVYLLANDEQYAGANQKLFQGWLDKHGALADKAAAGLQPIWSQPHSKPVSFEDVRAKSRGAARQDPRRTRPQALNRGEYEHVGRNPRRHAPATSSRR